MDGDSFAEDLIALLDLEVLDTNLFRGRNSAEARARRSLYGGQVAAQALRAAAATVPSDRLRIRCTATSCVRAGSTGR